MDTAGATARSARSVEWQACRELIERIGHETRLFDLVTRVDPEHRPEHVRIVDLGGHPVSIAVVVPRRVLLAGLPVEGAVVTLVGTDPGFRGRGLVRLLLEDAVAFLRAKGFRIGMLYGIPELYPKFGFIPCLGSYSTTFPPAKVQVSDGGTRHFWRPAADQDTPALAVLHAAVTAATPCTVLRTADKWIWREPGPSAGSGISVLQVERDAPGAALTEGGEAVGAYVRWSDRPGGPGPDTLVVSEVGAQSPPSLAEALRWTAAKAADLGRAAVRFIGPPDHPFARLAYLAAGAEVCVRAAAAGQVIVTNRGLLMADQAPAFERRAAAAGLAPGTRLTLDVGSKRFDLVLAGGRLRLLGGRAGRQGGEPVSRLSAEAFTFLLTGYAGGSEIETAPGVAVAPEHREALAALFPRAFPKWIPAPYWGD